MTRADGKVAGKYGRLPETADSLAVPYLHELATSPFPPLPPKVAVPDVADWGILGNDQYGNCLVEGTVVDAPDVIQAYRMPYAGSVVRVEFASGTHLTVTPNHAVLTPRGFVRARFLQEGDDAIGTRGTQRLGRTARGDNLDQLPTPIEQIFSTLSRRAADAGKSAKLRQMVKAVDFHGDERFVNGNVEVVGTKRLLHRELNPSLRQPHGKYQVGASRQLKGALHGDSTSLQGRRTGKAPTLGNVGRLSDLGTLRLGHLGVAQGQMIPLASQLTESSGFHQAHESVLFDSGFAGQGHRPLSGNVTLKERPHVWQQPVVMKSVRLTDRPTLIASSVHAPDDGGATDAQFATDLVGSFPGLVKTDRIVKIDRQRFHGFVYDLSTESRWYVGNNIITHNCVIAGSAHAINAWDVEVDLLAPAPTAADCIAQYCALTGCKAPGDANDTGLIIGSVMKDWGAAGLFGAADVPPGPPSKISAYARVSLGDDGMIRQGIACYGAVIAGFNMPQSAEDQFNAGENFTYVPGSPIVGGHCMTLVSYDGLWIQAVTWGTVVNVGPRFLQHYMDTAFVAIPPAFITAGRGPTLALAQLQADIGDLD